MKKIIETIKRHKWALFFAFLTSIIMVCPQLYFRYDNKEAYRGIDMAFTADEGFYFNRIQEVRDGHFFLGSAVLKDGKSDPYLHPPLPEIIVAFLGKIFFSSLQDTVHITRFIFSFIAFLIIYGFVFALSKSRAPALTASVVFFLGDSLLSRQKIVDFLHGGFFSVDFLPFTRPIHPEVSSVFFFGFLLSFLIFYKNKNWVWGVVSTLILGLSFYVYPFVWTFLYAFCGLLILIFLFLKNWQTAKRILLILLGGILIAIPYFLNLYRGLTHPNYSEISLRFGFIESHTPVLGFLVPFLFIFVLFLFPRKNKEEYIFSLALVIAPFIVLNQQIITGRIMGTGHYHYYYHRPLAIIFLVIIIFYWFNQKKWILPKKILMVLIIITSICTGFLVQKSSYAKYEEEGLKLQRFAPIIERLDNHAEKDEVIFSDLQLSDLIVARTSLNVFYSSWADLYLSASNQRILNSLFLLYRLDGLRGDEAEKVFLQEAERTKISSHVYKNYYREKTGDYANIPDDILRLFAAKYRDFLSIPIEKIWAENEVNYVIWDTLQHPQWSFDKYQSLNEFYREEGIIIYQFLKP